MERNRYQTSGNDTDRRDYDRFGYERERERDRDRDSDRRSAERTRNEDDGVAYTSRRRSIVPASPSPPLPPTTRVRERWPDSYGSDRNTYENEKLFSERRHAEGGIDDGVILPASARRRHPAPPAVISDAYDRTVTMERDKTLVRDRDSDRDGARDNDRGVRNRSPPRRPGRLIRRQSSLDTFDRRPARRTYDYERTPADTPLVDERILLSRRRDRGDDWEEEEERRGERDWRERRERLDERERRERPDERERDVTTTLNKIHIESERNEGLRRHNVRSYASRGGGGEEIKRERVRETTKVTERRSRSRSHSASRTSDKTRTTRSRRPRSPSPMSSVGGASLSSQSSSGTPMFKNKRSGYPKKGKTRMPSRLVSERVLIDLGYPFIKEGNTIVVQVALGQEDIDDVLQRSKRGDIEVIDSETKVKISDGEIIEKESRREKVYTSSNLPPPAEATTVVVQASPPSPEPAQMSPHITPAIEPEYTTTVRVRDVSPERSYTTARPSTTSMTRTLAHPNAVIVDAEPSIEVVEDAPFSPMALVAVNSRSRSRHRRSRSHGGSGDGALYAHVHDHPIRHDDRYYYDRHRHHHHRHHNRELVTAERLSTGELVVYDDEVERIEEPRRGLRIEKDKKGRMAIVVPKYR